MRYHHMILEGSWNDTAPQASSPLTALSGGSAPRFRFDTFMMEIDAILHAARPGSWRRLDTVLVDVRDGFLSTSLSGIVSVRRELARLAEAGITVVFAATNWGLTELYLGSAATERLIHPVGSLGYPGLARGFTFFRNLLDTNHVVPEVIRMGRYKAAGDSFRVADLDEHNRAQHEAILDAMIAEYEATTAAGYGRPVDDVAALKDGVMLGGKEAVAAGWCTEVATAADRLATWREAKARRARIRPAAPWKGRGRGKRIAVLVFEGAIRDGHNSSDALMGQSIGADDYVPVIRALERDKRVAGVVFRVNSGGGSATASESIAAELRRLAAKKPLAVSMSQVAGSGGYWIATPAKRIFVEPTTITGSIGVITLFFNIAERMRRWGVTHAVVKRGEMADAGSSWRSLTDRERTTITERIAALYGQFTQLVADSRGLTQERVHELGEGHIYAGRDAIGLGLADEIGGVREAAAWVASQAELSKWRLIIQPRIRRSLVQRLLGGGGGKSSPYRTGDLIPQEFAALASPAARLFASELTRRAGTPLAITEMVIADALQG